MTVGGYLSALALTVVIEAPLLLAYAVRALGEPLRRALGSAVAINLVTHPLLTVLMTVTPADGRSWIWVAGEVAVIAVEGWLLGALWRCRGWAPYAVAAVANSASVVVGWLLLGPPA